MLAPRQVLETPDKFSAYLTRPPWKRRAFWSSPLLYPQLAVRPQTVRPQAFGERRIRPVEPEPDRLVEQHHRPHVRIISQALAQTVHERPERIGSACRRRSLPSDPAAGQVDTDRLAVMPQVPDDRRHRPALARQSVHIHVVLLCEHPVAGSFEELVEVKDRHPRRDPPLRSDATQEVLKVRRFAEQVWGDSDERHHQDAPRSDDGASRLSNVRSWCMNRGNS